MKIAIMQPYFFPYLGYISLIKHADKFILLDEVQFIRHGWIERNRILSQNGGWMYLQAPLIKENGRETLIKNCFLDNEKKWKVKILAQLQHYKKRAPYFHQVLSMLKDTLSPDFKTITEFNKNSLEHICTYLGFTKIINIFSELDLGIEIPNNPDEWALNICKVIHGEINYINPIGGKAFFDIEKYKKNNINIFFQKFDLIPYQQFNNVFEPGLSIIDVMMFNSPKECNELLDKFTLIR